MRPMSLELRFQSVRESRLFSAPGKIEPTKMGPCRGKHTGEQALFRELMPRLESGDIDALQVGF
jgi:hypothetical protein